MFGFRLFCIYRRRLGTERERSVYPATNDSVNSEKRESYVRGTKEEIYIVRNDRKGCRSFIESRKETENKNNNEDTGPCGPVSSQPIR